MLAVCADGWDPEYVDDALDRRLMPRLAEALGAGGTYALARAQVPTFTNPDNVTIHAAALQAGVEVLCVTARDKLRQLLQAGNVPTFSAERAHEQSLADGTPVTEAVGRPNPGFNDPELSHYTIDLAVALAGRLEAKLVYASLTDFVQHTVAPREPLADDFYRAVDASLGRALDAGFAVGLVADHGMRAKTLPDGTPNVRFLDEALVDAGVHSAHTLCPITDPYVVHHAALGSLAWVHLDDPDELDRARGALASLPGVEGVLDRSAAADSLELPADRIGDLVVLANADTVLGWELFNRDLHELLLNHVR